MPFRKLNGLLNSDRANIIQYHITLNMCRNIWKEIYEFVEMKSERHLQYVSELR